MLPPLATDGFVDLIPRLKPSEICPKVFQREYAKVGIRCIIHCISSNIHVVCAQPEEWAASMSPHHEKT